MIARLHAAFLSRVTPLVLSQRATGGIFATCTPLVTSAVARISIFPCQRSIICPPSCPFSSVPQKSNIFSKICFSKGRGRSGILERFKTSLVVWRKIETIDKIGKCVPDNR